MINTYKSKGIISTTITTQIKSSVAHRLVNLLLICIGVAFIGVFAQIRIVLPFTPVPVTGQTLALLLIVFSYGQRLSIVTIATYLLVGFLGAPVFAGGASGFIISAASFGYLVGMFVAAIVGGYFVERGFTRGYLKFAFVLLISNIIIYFFGLLHLSFILKTGFAETLSLGLLPFIPGDILKLVIITLLLPTASKIADKIKK